MGKQQIPENEDLDDGRSVVGTIFLAVRFYVEDNQKHPSSVQELIEEEYLSIDETTAANWEFGFDFAKDKIVFITATSTDKMSLGKGWMVIFDFNTGEREVFPPEK